MQLLEDADLLLDATQAGRQLFAHRMSPPRWVMIFGSPGRTRSAYSVSPRSSSRRSASAAAGASARLDTMVGGPVGSASGAGRRSGGTTTTPYAKGRSSGRERRPRGGG